jgi:hypothetical protein
MSEIQSVLFNKDYFTKTQAKQWLSETKNLYRYRQTEPNKYRNFRMKRIDDGIQFVLGFY